MLILLAGSPGSSSAYMCVFCWQQCTVTTIRYLEEEFYCFLNLLNLDFELNVLISGVGSGTPTGTIGSS